MAFSSTILTAFFCGWIVASVPTLFFHSGVLFWAEDFFHLLL